MLIFCGVSQKISHIPMELNATLAQPWMEKEGKKE
jgi:hypothetical protein